MAHGKGRTGLGAVITGAVLLLGSPSSWAVGAEIQIDETRSLEISAVLRTSFTAQENGSASGDSFSKDFEVDDTVVFLKGQLTENLGIQLGVDRGMGGNDDIRVMDAYVHYKVAEAFRVRAGRMLLPVDRSNLAGPFLNTTYRFPLFASRYPNTFIGRDDGAAVWGLLGGGAIKYQVGAFEGRDGRSNTDDKLAYAGRITVNLLDPERRWYTATTYYGKKEILALGLAGMTQNDGAGTAANSGDFTGWSADLLYEDHLGPGVATLEGAYYSYDRGGAPPNLRGAATPRPDGDAYLGQVAYLLQPSLGPGRFQPHVRYQHFDTGPTEQTRIEGGINYVIKGHFARFSAVVGEKDNNLFGADGTFFLVGAQLWI